MPGWELLFLILIVLAAALVCGTIAEQIRQSAILGYLVAGTLVGPHVLGLVNEREQVEVIAELGVALLLFTIGLEFSFRRLRRMGRIALLGGSLQVVATLAVGALIAAVFGLGARASIAVGAMLALSSTACVLRLLLDRGTIDSLYGRNALGILLLQDLAVIPLMLVVVLLSTEGTVADMAVGFLKTVLAAIALVVGFFLVFNLIVPRILDIDKWSRNRELPILFAIVLALGSAYAAHAVSLSPAIGAFVAGVLLGESPLATQIRADVSSLRTLLVTLFFASIGMLGNPAWILGHWHMVLGAVLLVLVVKVTVTGGVVRMLGFTPGVALAAGLCLAQVGEFSFVLAETARSQGTLISGDLFDLIVSTTIMTLFLTPFQVAAAPHAAVFVESLRRRIAPHADAGAIETDEHPPTDERGIVIIGFGPAGQAVAELLYRSEKDQIAVIELNPRTAAVAQRLGLLVHRGDATHREVLEHAGVGRAKVIAITVPDASTTRSIIDQCRQLAPDAVLIARSRYHVRRWELELAGAHTVVDEEAHVGRRIAAFARRSLRAAGRTADADAPREG